MHKVYHVGVYIEEEFTEFATCTTYKAAEKAKKYLTDGGWGDVEIEVDNMYLNTITINDVTYNLLDE